MEVVGGRVGTGIRQGFDSDLGKGVATKEEMAGIVESHRKRCRDIEAIAPEIRSEGIEGGQGRDRLGGKLR